MQFISLSSGGFLGKWAETHRAIRNLHQLCHNSLQNGDVFTKPDIDQSKAIYLRRRVFSKVSEMIIGPLSVIFNY
jgi:hypothetical protein